jgi:hypothetical protein
VDNVFSKLGTLEEEFWKLKIPHSQGKNVKKPSRILCVVFQKNP